MRFDISFDLHCEDLVEVTPEYREELFRRALSQIIAEYGVGNLEGSVEVDLDTEEGFTVFYGEYRIISEEKIWE